MASRRAVLLISQQLNPAVDNLLHALGASEGEPVPPMNAKVVPIIGNVWYARHLAVTIVDADIWDNEESTLLEVLCSARRWDHRGWRSASSSASGSLNSSSNTGRAGRCEEWSENDIQTIRAVQKLGEICKTDDEISESAFDPLFQDWEYFPVWWNCQEFAIRLAYILLESNHAAVETLVSLAREFRQQIVERLSHARSNHADLFAQIGPLNTYDGHRFNWWLCNMWKLQQRIPALQGFHCKLYQGWTWMERRRKFYCPGTHTSHHPRFNWWDMLIPLPLRAYLFSSYKPQTNDCMDGSDGTT